jgi:lysyl-tRNA synthetase, class II
MLGYLNLFRFIPRYEAEIVDVGKEPLLFLLLSFLVAFVITRLYTRVGRARGWGSGSVGGVHLHHVVPGIILVLGAGLLAFTPGGREGVVLELLAIVFGAGAALVLDEFALLLHLKDVYWSEEGRSSIDALIIGALLGAVMLLTTAPWQPEQGPQPSGPRVGVFVGLTVSLFLSLLCFLKSKRFLGLAGLVVPPISFVGALRLGKPRSPWARWFYRSERGAPKRATKRARKLERSQQRFNGGRLGRFERWFTDVVGGRSDPTPPTVQRAACD